MVFPGFSFVWRGLAIVVLAMLAGSCTVVVDEGPGPRPLPPRPQVCTAEYVPVCAVRGHDRQTFANACSADRAGYRIVRRGQCRRGEPNQSRPAICTREYRPVCARRGGAVRTFGNACEARAADFRILGEGPC